MRAWVRWGAAGLALGALLGGLGYLVGVQLTGVAWQAQVFAEWFFAFGIGAGAVLMPWSWLLARRPWAAAVLGLPVVLLAYAARLGHGPLGALLAILAPRDSRAPGGVLTFLALGFFLVSLANLGARRLRGRGARVAALLAGSLLLFFPCVYLLGTLFGEKISQVGWREIGSLGLPVVGLFALAGEAGPWLLGEDPPAPADPGGGAPPPGR